MLDTFWFNFTHNLFNPLLLFFYLGFAMSLFKVPLEYPKAMYQFLTIYLLISIGWHGGEELASLSAANTKEVLKGSCTQMTETQTAFGSLLA